VPQYRTAPHFRVGKDEILNRGQFKKIANKRRVLRDFLYASSAMARQSRFLLHAASQAVVLPRAADERELVLDKGRLEHIACSIAKDQIFKGSICNND
jgi:hypothetical protein